MKHGLLKLNLFLGTALLAACSVGPDYKPPQVEAPTQYKEGSAWKPARPNDDVIRGDWWMIYNDPLLDKLERQVEISNQNLKAAEAAWRQARAIVDQSRSQLFPTVTLDASGTRSGGGSVKNGPVNSFSLNGGASWVPDLWGRIRRTVEGDVASAQASAADLALAKLSAQSQLAIDYFSLRGQDELIRLLNATVQKQRKSMQIVKNQYDAGIAAKADVLTSQTQLESVQSQAINAGVVRAQLEHAIAVLIGKPPAEVAIPSGRLAEKVPEVPAGVPSALLERRPDIAAAERQMAVANAQIGVAVSAWFPSLTLSASGGYTGVSLAHLISVPNSLWSFGPALAETIFDAGLRQAQIEEAHATYDQTVANYRQTVLTGFQQVEDQLSTLRILGQQAKIQKQVVADARKSEQLVLNQYKEGTVPLSSFLAAQITTLNNEQTAVTVTQNRLTASVSLIEALGGGWSTSQLSYDELPPKTPDKSGPPAIPAPASVPVPAPVRAPVAPMPAPAPAPVPPVQTDETRVDMTPHTISNINPERQAE